MWRGCGEPRRSGTMEPLHAVDPSLLGTIRECVLHARDQDSEGLVLHAGGYEGHVSVRAALTSPLSQDGLEASYVGGYKHAAFGGCQFHDLRIGEPFELH